MTEAALRCPVCRAGFRNAAICSRCGADLAPMMSLAARAWWLRECARQMLKAGDFGGALKLASEAQRVHATLSGQSLHLVAAWAKGTP